MRIALPMRGVLTGSFRVSLVGTLFFVPPEAHAAVTISANATTNIVCTNGVCTPNHKFAVLNVTDLQNLLAAGNVTVNTAGAKASDILVSAGISWVSAHTLTLDAYQSITVNKAIAVAGSGGLSLLTDDGGSGGALSFGTKGDVTFWSLTSPLSINGSTYTLVGNIATLASDVASNSSGHFALAADYNASVDGTYTNAPILTFFSGVFEGLGNTISKLSIAEGPSTGREIGLFGIIETGGAVENIRLTKVDIAANVDSSFVGGLVGTSSGILSGDSVTGRVVGGDNSIAGGLAGDNAGGVISDSSANVAVTVRGYRNDSGYLSVGGGLVGGNGNYGDTEGTISNSFATGTVTGGFSAIVGGLAGSGGTGTISNSYATGAVSGGRLSDAGGLVGEFGAISQCYATGNVSGGNNSSIGGLLGADLYSISNSYTTGSATGGTKSNVGGLVGNNIIVNNSPGTIAQSYSTGAASGGAGSSVGGLLGFDGTPAGSITDAYWDTTSSGIANQGAGNINNDPGITGLTTTQLQAGLPAGFGNSIWGENADINSGLPYLLAIPPA